MKTRHLILLVFLSFPAWARADDSRITGMRTPSSDSVRINKGGGTPQTGGFYVQGSTIEANQDEQLRLIRHGAAGPFKNNLLSLWGESGGGYFKTVSYGYFNTSGAGWGIMDSSDINQLRVVRGSQAGLANVSNEVRNYSSGGSTYVGDASSATIPTSYTIVRPNAIGSVGQVRTIASIVGTAAFEAYQTPGTTGDMLKSTYDTNSNGIVDVAASVSALGLHASALNSDIVGSGLGQGGSNELKVVADEKSLTVDNVNGYVKIKSTGTANTYTKATITTDVYGRVIAASNGSVGTVPFTFSYKAAVCQGPNSSLGFSGFAASTPTAACVSASSVTFGVAQFTDNGATQTVQDHIQLPSDWTGAVDANIMWRSTATSNSVVWQIRTSCTADGEVAPTSWNPSSTVTDAAKGTTLQFNTAAMTGISTSNCSAGEEMFFEFYRNPSHASDTLASAGELISLLITIRRAL